MVCDVILEGGGGVKLYVLKYDEGGRRGGSILSHSHVTSFTDNP